MANSVEFAFSSLENDEYEIAESKIAYLRYLVKFDNQLKNKIIDFLFTQFILLKNVNIKKLILDEIFTFDKDIIWNYSDRIDINKMIESKNTQERDMGILFVEHFYNYYEMNMVLMFALRKVKRIRKLMSRNELYRTHFQIKEKYEEETEKNGELYTLSNDLIEHKERIEESRSLYDLKIQLNIIYKQIKTCNIRLILNHFITKTEIMLIYKSNAIPGVQTNMVVRGREELDTSLQLKMYNLKNTDDYLFIRQIFNELSQK